MTFWASVLAQGLGDLMAGALLLSVGLYLENWLDERRSARHDHTGTVVVPEPVGPFRENIQAPVEVTVVPKARPVQTVRLLSGLGRVLEQVTVAGRPTTIRHRTEDDQLLGVFHPYRQAPDGVWEYRRMGVEKDAAS